MSRIGNRVLYLKDNVEINIATKNLITVKGPKGTLIKHLPAKIKIIVNENQITTTRPNNLKHNKQLHGTCNAILEGMLTGVVNGFTKKLLITGVGYRANIQDKVLNLSLGFSHPVQYLIPNNVEVVCSKPTEIIVSGIDKQLVGQVAAHIRAFRKSEPYKGKGIKYENEVIILKEGKSSGK